MSMFSESKKPINVYWSPYFEGNAPMDWSFLYPKPETLFSELLKNKSMESKKGSMFSCPAFYGKFKKTLVFRNSIESSYFFDAEGENKIVEHKSDICIEAGITKPKSLDFGPIIEFAIMNLLFADEPLEINMTAPFFHEPKYTKFGSIVTGEYDIGQWFRPLSLEIQMWKNKGELYFEKDEPLFYVELKTKRPVLLHRFNLSEKIVSYSKANAYFRNFFGPNTPLIDRYTKFNQVGYREKILTEIKKNLIDEQPYKF